MPKLINAIKELFTKRFYLFFWLIIAFAGVLVYTNSLDAEFQLDDNFHILNREDIQNIHSYNDLQKWINFNERPLSSFTLAVNYQLHGFNVFGYHVFNIFVHILAAILVYLLANQILQSPVIRKKEVKQHRRLIAFFCGLIFVMHPIQTQSVTYIIQRMTSLAGLFYLMSVYFYIKGRFSFIKNRPSTATTLLTLAFASAVLAMLSKQTAITIPIAWLMVEFFFVRDKNKKPCKKFLISGFLILVTAVVLIFCFIEIPRETDQVSRYDYGITQLRVFTKYLQLSVFPIVQNLDYDFPISHSLRGAKEIISLIVVVLFIITGVALFKKHPVYSFSIFWFILTLSVESTIIPISDVIFEHRLYLPIFGVIMILVTLLFELLGKKNVKIFIVVMMLVSLFYGILTYARNEVWQTNYTLWQDVVKKSPDKSRPHLNYGNALLERGDMRSAILHFTKAIEADPQNWSAYFNRGNVRINTGNYEGAIQDLNIFIEQYPDLPDPHNNSGKAKMLAGDFSGAFMEFNKTITLDSTYEKAWFNRGNTRMLIGDYKGAIDDFRKAIQLKTNNPPAYNNIAQAYVNLNKPDSALYNFNKAVELDHNYAKAYFNRANLYLTINQYQKALQDLNRTISIDPSHGKAYQGRGLLNYKRKNYRQAFYDLSKAREHGIEISAEFINKVETKMIRQSDQ